MTLPTRFFLFLLLLSVLKPCRLTASSPSAENFVKYVAEEGSYLFDEITEEDASINHLSPLNVTQTAPHLTEERSISIETSPTPIVENHSITDPTSSFSEASSITTLAEQPVDFRDDIPMDYAPSIGTMTPPVPIDKILGARILALSQGPISIFLRSPEAKQTAYKAYHQQTVQKLQTKYPNLAYPALAQKITVWNQAIENWNSCYISKEQEKYYQDVTALVPDMPLELYRLVALSKAMKIMEDSIVYTRYFPLAWKKYSTDPNSNVYQSYFFRKIDSVNTNIENLEKAASSIITLSEQKNRCLIYSAAEKESGDVDMSVFFDAALMTVEQAITFYCQFGKKMREGDVPAASLLRRKGASLENIFLTSEPILIPKPS